MPSFLEQTKNIQKHKKNPPYNMPIAFLVAYQIIADSAYLHPGHLPMLK